MALLLEHGPRPAQGRSGPPSGASWVLSLAVVVLLGVVLPVYIVDAGTPDRGHALSMAILWAICLFSSARLAGFVLHRRPQLIRLAFYIFCYAFIGLAPLGQLAAGAFPLTAYIPRAANIADHEVVFRTTVLFLVGIVAHEAGYLIRRRSRERLEEAAARGVSRTRRSVLTTFNPSLIQALCLASIAVTILAVLFSGLGPFFTSREAAGEALYDDVAGAAAGALDSGGVALIWYRVTHVVPFAALLLILHLVRNDPSKRTVGFLLLATGVSACNVIVNNPVGNSRLWAGVVAFGILSVFVDLRRPRAVAATAIGMTAAFVLVFPYADAFRRSGGLSFSFDSPVEELVDSQSFSAFQTAANGLRYVDAEGLSWGNQLLAGLFAFIPRTIWTSKPPDTGFVVDPIYNRAVPFWTEMHVNFAMVGVVAGLLILGALARRADDDFISGYRWALLMVPIFSPYYFILLRGTLSAAVGTMLPLVLVLALPLLTRTGKRHKLSADARRPVGGHSPVTST